MSSTDKTPIRRVALVDDDSDVRRLGELALANVGGWDCVCFASAADARDGLAAAAVDVALLDVSLGKDDGVVLLGELRAAGFEVPVVFLTGSVRDVDVARYAAAGAIGVIAKPFDPMRLAEEVRQRWNAR